MLGQILIRFLIGGLVVTTFAFLGEVLRPKSFAGLFGAAPTVALATLGLTLLKEGAATPAVECRSMIFGAMAFFVYAKANELLIMKARWRALPAASATMGIWFAASFGLWALVLGGAAR